MSQVTTPSELPSADVLLCAQNVGKHFGGVTALKDVSLTINKGEIYGLIGPNGAGKTTFFNVLTGLYSRDEGRIEFDGKALPSANPTAIAQAGIARTFQNIRLFGQMTALENVMVGQHTRSRQGVFGAILRHAANRAEEAAIRAKALDLLRYVGIAERANDLARNLSYGDQRRLEIARALATQPKLLALDEPAAGMNPTERLALAELIRGLRDDGLTILLIEHDVKLVMGLCDRLAVLDYGQKIAEDVPSIVQQNSRVISAYLGSEDAQQTEQAASTDRAKNPTKVSGAQPLLSVLNLGVHYGGIAAVKGISFTVEAGEMVCLIGANGAGKTSTLKAIAQMQSASGEVHYQGKDIARAGHAPHDLIAEGLALVPEGRGVFARLSVLDNLRMGAFHRQDKDVDADIQRIFGLLPRLQERQQQLAGTLSGGEQQMLAMGRALMGRPKLLLLDEPSMGLAPLMVEKIFELIQTIAKDGVSILLVEQNARLALHVCDRGYVLESGQITLTGPAHELAQDERVRAAYLGE
jgi:branched-chain amino acid transport system ATP-binding protein